MDCKIIWIFWNSQIKSQGQSALPDLSRAQPLSVTPTGFAWLKESIIRLCLKAQIHKTVRYIRVRSSQLQKSCVIHALEWLLTFKRSSMQNNLLIFQFFLRLELPLKFLPKVCLLHIYLKKIINLLTSLLQKNVINSSAKYFIPLNIEFSVMKR